MNSMKRESPKGLLLSAFEETDTEPIVAARVTRDQTRADNPFTANAAALQNCRTAVAFMRDRVLNRAPIDEVRLLADAGSAIIAKAIRSDPYGLRDFSDIQFTLVDTLSGTDDVEICSSRSLVALSLQLHRDAETHAANWLLDKVEQRLQEDRWLSEGRKLRTFADLAIVWCGLADLCEGSRRRDKQLTRIRRAWVFAEQADISIRRFVIWRYRVVLERQKRRPELIEAARILEARLNLEAGPITDWIYECLWSI